MATNAGATNAGERSTENDWLFDYIVQFLKSPPWTVPLNNFIDENCMVFDDDEENKFSYTEIHKKFIALMDGLLERNLMAIGVTDEQFLAACEKGATQQANKLIFGQILAVNDFLTFKKMMVKRNIELNVEVMRALSKAVPHTLTTKPNSKAEEEAQIAAAIRISHEQALLDAVKRQLHGTSAAYPTSPAAATTATTATSGAKPPAATAPAATSAATTTGSGITISPVLAQPIKPLPAAATTAGASPLKTTDGKTISHDDEIKAALAASVMEDDIRRAERAKEQAEIEHAIALSLALEKMNQEKATTDDDDLVRAQKESEESAKAEQQRILDAAAKAHGIAQAEAKARADAKALGPQTITVATAVPPPAKEPIVVSFEPVPIAALRKPATPTSTPGTAQVITSASASAPAAAAPAATPATDAATPTQPAANPISQKLVALQSPAKPRVAPEPEPVAVAPAKSAPSAASAAPVTAAPAPAIVTTAPSTAPTAKPATTPTASASSLPALGKLPALPSLGGAPRPSSELTFSAMSQRADMLFKANREQKHAQKTAEATAAAKSGVSDVELQRRQAFMRAQRDLILQRKKAEGEAALKAHALEQQTRPQPKPAAPAPTGPGAVATPQVSASDALAKRLKAEFEANQKRKAEDEAAAKFAALDEQLRRVEELQREKQKRLADEEQRLIAQEKERQSKLAAFHKALQQQNKP